MTSPFMSGTLISKWKKTEGVQNTYWKINKIKKFNI